MLLKATLLDPAFCCFPEVAQHNSALPWLLLLLCAIHSMLLVLFFCLWILWSTCTHINHMSYFMYGLCTPMLLIVLIMQLQWMLRGLQCSNSLSGIRALRKRHTQAPKVYDTKIAYSTQPNCTACPTCLLALIALLCWLTIYMSLVNCVQVLSMICAYCQSMTLYVHIIDWGLSISTCPWSTIWTELEYD